MDNTVRVAILVGDQVIATSDDLAAVRVSASMMAHNDETDPVLWPLAEGRSEACRQIAMGEV